MCYGSNIFKCTNATGNDKNRTTLRRLRLYSWQRRRVYRGPLGKGGPLAFTYMNYTQVFKGTRIILETCWYIFYKHTSQNLHSQLIRFTCQPCPENVFGKCLFLFSLQQLWLWNRLVLFEHWRYLHGKAWGLTQVSLGVKEIKLEWSCINCSFWPS